MPEPIRVQVMPRWSDTDQYGHVNSISLLSLVEEARIRGLGLPDQPGNTAPGDPPPLFAVLEDDTFTIVAGQRVEYAAEMPYTGRPVVAELWLSRVGSSSVTMDCRLVDESGERVYLIASVTVVIMSISDRRPRKLTPAELETLDGHVGAANVYR